MFSESTSKMKHAGLSCVFLKMRGLLEVGGSAPKTTCEKHDTIALQRTNVNPALKHCSGKLLNTQLKCIYSVGSALVFMSIQSLNSHRAVRGFSMLQFSNTN